MKWPSLPFPSAPIKKVAPGAMSGILCHAPTAADPRPAQQLLLRAQAEPGHWLQEALLAFCGSQETSPVQSVTSGSIQEHLFLQNFLLHLDVLSTTLNVGSLSFRLCAYAKIYYQLPFLPHRQTCQELFPRRKRRQKKKHFNLRLWYGHLCQKFGEEGDYLPPFFPKRTFQALFPKGKVKRKANTISDSILDFCATDIINLVPYLFSRIAFKQWFTIWAYFCPLWSTVEPSDGPSSWKLAMSVNALHRAFPSPKPHNFDPHPPQIK